MPVRRDPQVLARAQAEGRIFVTFDDEALWLAVEAIELRLRHGYVIK